jgi:hypothetical protein
MHAVYQTCCHGQLKLLAATGATLNLKYVVLLLKHQPNKHLLSCFCYAFV